MKRSSAKAITIRIILSSLAIICLLVAVWWLMYEIRSDSKIPANTTTKNQGIKQDTKIPPQTFDAERFHDQVQVGMSYYDVVDLATGQAEECEYSGAPAPIDYRYCTWQDGSTVVTVSFKDMKVTTKSKRDL